MTRKDRERLETALRTLSPAERKALSRRAHQFRKAARAADRAGGDDLPVEEEDELALDSRRRSRESLDPWLLQALDHPDADAAETADTADGPTALVLTATKKGCIVWSEGRELRCTLPAWLAKRQQELLAPGDMVTVETGADGEPWIGGVLPRRGVLYRPHPGGGGGGRILAANVDAVVLVISLVAPPFRASWVDRAILGIRRGEAEPLVCVNKADLLSDPDDRARALEPLRAHTASGVTVIPTSVETGEGIAALLDALAGKLCAFLGHSGVGKSSLLTAMRPDLVVRVGEVRAFDGKGRHTTTSSMLYELPNGARIIDTPGIRVLGLPDLESDEAEELFPAIAALAPQCRFRDCEHRSEPGCAVLAAVEEGRLPREVWERYAHFE